MAVFFEKSWWNLASFMHRERFQWESPDEMDIFRHLCRIFDQPDAFSKGPGNHSGRRKLAEMRLAHAQDLDADPNLKLVSERSPYMRTER